jgi:hypothetical protein
VKVIEFARANDIHLLCLPAHTTHILQPLDVGVFKSFKSFFSKACTNYIAKHPGRVITADILASLVAEAWPSSFTSVNIMSGFKKCGLFPFNPSAVDDRQSAPSKAFQVPKTPKTPAENHSDPGSGSPLFTSEQEELFTKRFAEGYDLADPAYVAWVKINHPDKTMSASPSSISGNSSSAASVASPSSGPASSVLSKVLVLPKPRTPKRKRKQAINSKAVCITDSPVLQGLIEIKQKAAEEKQLLAAKKLEKDKKKQEKVKEIEKKKGETEDKNNPPKRGKQKRGRRRVEKQKNREVPESDNEDGVVDNGEVDDAMCPKCGKSYKDDDNLWICCDGCNRWFDVQCTKVNKTELPENYYCDECEDCTP